MIIGIDCTERKGGLAIDDNYFELEYIEDIPQKLITNGIKPSNIEKILITLGPGSFTSLRIGLAAAQGISEPHDIPILGYSSFLAMIGASHFTNTSHFINTSHPINAPQSHSFCHLIPLLSARKGIVYAAHFIKRDESVECIFTDRVMKIDELLSYTEGIKGNIEFLGSGAETNKDLLSENNDSIISPTPPIALNLLGLYKKGIKHTVNPSIPFYLAPSEAIRKREQAKLNLRPMKPQDIKEIVNIEKDVFPEPWDADIFYLTLIKEQCRCIVGTVDENLASYMIGCKEGKKFHLMNIAISREHWRKRYGTKMLNHLLKELEKDDSIESCFLELRIHNKAAFDLYKTFGFRVLQIEPGYYTNGDDAVVMEIGV